MMAALLILSSSAFATDAYTYKNLGFSADGRYYAFVESVIGDGSGFPIARGQVIDVVRNRTVVMKQAFIEDEKATEKTAIGKVTAEMNLRHYGIDGRNLGEPLWIRLETDLSLPVRQAVFSPNYYVEGGSSSVWPKLQLDITEHDAPTEKDQCFSQEPSKMITLSLTNLQDNLRRDLQIDSRAPSNRKCSWGYQLRQVLTYRGSIAAVLRYETFGFEGPDYNHMVVTGDNAVKN